MRANADAAAGFCDSTNLAFSGIRGLTDSGCCVFRPFHVPLDE